jgi:hypothetical protein
MPNNNKSFDDGSADARWPYSAGCIRSPRHENRLIEEAFWYSLDDGGSFALDGKWVEVRQLGDGPAVLLLHGNCGRGSNFMPLMAALAADGMRAVSLDLPGFEVQVPACLTVDYIAQAILHVSTRARIGSDGWHGIVAHSLANTWAHYAAALGLGCERYVSVGSACDATLCDEFVRALLGLEGMTRRGTQQLAWRERPTGGSSRDWPRLGRSALIVQAADHDSLPAERDAFAAAANWTLRWPGSVYLAIGGCSNDGVLSNSTFIERTTRFLDRLPSPPMNTRGLF